MTKLVDNLRVLVGALFYLGIGGFVLGHLVTFVPGAEETYFITIAVLLAFGLVIPGWHRVIAIVLLVLCGFEIYQGHQRGLKYRQHNEEFRAKRGAGIPES